MSEQIDLKTYNAICKDQFEKIDRSIASLDEVGQKRHEELLQKIGDYSEYIKDRLDGKNGTPGLQDRVRDLEQSRKNVVKVVWAVSLTVLAQLGIWIRSKIGV